MANRFDPDLNSCPAPSPGDPDYPYVKRANNYD